MLLAKLIPSRFLSSQARKPSGWFGRVVMTRLFDKANADINNFVKESLVLQEKDHVLEIGFGPGRLLHDVASIVSEGAVEGIDFSETMLAQASFRNREHIARKRIKLQLGDCQSLPYEENTFDKVCTVNTIYFWNDPDKNLREIMRVLKQGGRLVLGFRDRAHLESLPLSRDIFNLYSSDEVQSLLSAAGFSDIRIEKRVSLPFESYCSVAVKSF